MILLGNNNVVREGCLTDLVKSCDTYVYDQLAGVAMVHIPNELVCDVTVQR